MNFTSREFGGFMYGKKAAAEHENYMRKLAARRARSQAPPRRATPPKAKSRTPPRRNSPKARASSVNNFNRAARNRQTLNLYVQKWIGINSRGNKLVKIGLYVHPNKNPSLNKAKLNRLARLYTELLNAKKRGGVTSSRR